MISKKTLITRDNFDKLILPIYNPIPFIPIKGKGSRIWDQKGKEYIDFSGGIAVTSLGHCHPILNKTLKNQSKMLWHLSNIFTNEPALRLAKKLLSSSFASRIFFANSGAEANEAAFKLARYYSSKIYNFKKNKIISFYNSFHGRTFFTVSVGGQSKYSNNFGPKPAGIVHASFNDINSVKNLIDHDTCAVVVELIQGEGGVIPANLTFVQALKELCKQYNVLLIFDEIQTGIGRTGKLFYYEYYAITPDILTIAKSLGGGFPISAMLTTNEVASVIAPGIHGTTYGGNPLACAVAESVIDIINTKKVLSGVEKKSKKIISELNIINKRFKLFTEIRGRGLLIGIVLKPNVSRNIHKILNFSFSEGVIFLTAGNNVIRLAPSLIIKELDIIEGMKRFYRALEKYLSRKE
ncbi:aspartate aminotransferase family protein [Buchnera aphidicola]|uniref:Acetylornithine/succinyldiaminopimelate aminotransferase n=1 Tax=Buchnera aphidicola subsp. Acyrthosiphon pisum (strain 5A) TaxID=563178 RepID=A0A7U4DII1_BUCA5|nr:aspartate aminotransferase family protein [Buchnera aphidicola]ACL30324.1 bifunctional N-succinyldiaminopimelate-aminotransferase/acetylornithine transaminase protein [Buchnera aphidicola str. Tuc7 (Acyrthosiphon pisum)]ACL30878.1 bifunctional N-succinyldiaminopimelate-aminotransferase/acetylornithine transaminase protein [Buchnera aphidicola str. 5A (Acyrthosiphon pisum)]ADP67500.1 bifunctional N-succinyldiaminopimelate-aminotransferase/acetylornithine transaminase protein [Buchnera aphidico